MRRGCSSLDLIRVKGQLDLARSAWFDGLEVQPQAIGETMLVGPLVDQAALHGVLMPIHDLGAPVAGRDPHGEPWDAEAPQAPLTPTGLRLTRGPPLIPHGGFRGYALALGRAPFSVA
jgi:hypothetical protein